MILTYLSKSKHWLLTLFFDRHKEYIVDGKRKLIYLIISKNACSSIKASFIEKEVYENNQSARITCGF